MKKTKVLQISHDCENPFPSVCGKYVQLFDPHRYAVTTVYLRGNPAEQVERKTGGARVLFYMFGKGSLRGIKFKAIFRLYRLCRREKYSVVIAHRYKAIYLAGMISYFVPIPLLLGVAHEHQVFSRISRHLFLTFWRTNIKILAVSNAVNEDILTTCPSLRQQNRVFTLHHSLDLADSERELMSRAAARKALGLDRGRFVFGTVGRLVGKKDHHTLLRAFAGMTDDESILVLMGSGGRESQLKSLAQELHITDRVIFLGHVPNAATYLKALDVFVLTSRENEAFGLVLLEAMLARVPIISSDAKGPVEVVGNTGSLFRVANVDDLALKMEQAHRQTTPERERQVELAYLHLQEQFSTAAFHGKFWQMDLLAKLAD